MSEFLERITKLSPKRLALLAVELNSKLERLNRRETEPIAVTGIGCRFPGGANSPDAFWRLLAEGRDAIVEVPRTRWDINAFYDPDPEAPGKMCTRWGGFLDDVEQFDPEFFGISPREAARMDPQQRILLEVVWEALENAGQSPQHLAGSQTGVFVGLCNNDYFLMQFEDGREAIDAYVATGNAHSVASGRISYILGLQGPSLSVDTGCSASLVAVHLACQSLRAGECRAALAGGTNLVLMPDTTIVLSKAHMMSPDGRCKAFDASANGFVRSEGCGVVVLKRLSDARADNDRILAVIRGTAANQDGRSNGLTAPNGPSQVAVIRDALANAGLQPGDIEYIEAHGTGTSLGDPIEARALAEVFGTERPQDQPLHVGSVKSNIGHTEAAAGIAGLIKSILALHHEIIPPSLHLKQLNPHIDWNGLPLRVPVTPTPWTRKRGLRVASVSSFGFSGTNAHVIVSDPPIEDGNPVTGPSNRLGLESLPPVQLLPLSARKEPALRALARSYEMALSDKPDLDLAAICRTAAQGRSHFEHRLAIVADDVAQAKARLAAFQRGEKDTRIRTGRSNKAVVPRVVFAFTGQGSQYAGMGRELFETEAVFRRELEKCAELLNPVLRTSLLDLILSNGAKFGTTQHARSLLDETEYAQPAIFALEYALAVLWQSWGVQPDAVVGHSVGEYVAACIAGVFSLEDGLHLIAVRGRLMATLPRDGAMAAVLAEESRVASAIAAESGGVEIACINGPANVVISGRSNAVERIVRNLAQEGIRSQRLEVSHAFHSQLMVPILDAFQGEAAKIRLADPLVAVASTVTGKIGYPGLMSSPEYWRRQIRQPVRFADSIRALRETGRSVFLEVGPHPVLCGMAKAAAPADQVVWTASLNRSQGNWETLLDAASTLYVHGVDFNWTGLQAASQGKSIDLPVYPFQRSRYWLERSDAKSLRTPGHAGEVGKYSHPFLGRIIDSPAIEGTVFELQFGANRPAFLNDHRILGHVIMPSPAYIEMAIAGRAEVSHVSLAQSVPCEVTDLIVREPLFLPDSGGCRVQLFIENDPHGGSSFGIYSKNVPEKDSEHGTQFWRTHASGHVHLGIGMPEGKIWNREGVWARCAEEISSGAFYESLAEVGLEFGSRFRGIARVRRRDGEAVGEIKLPDSLADETSQYRIHPALLDSCFHLLGAAIPSSLRQNAYLLIGIERFSLFTLAPERFWTHTVFHPIPGSSPETLRGDTWLYDDDGRLIAEIVGMHLKKATAGTIANRDRANIDSWFYDLAWREQDVSGSQADRTGTTASADFIPAPASLVEQAQQKLRDVQTVEALTVYDDLIPKLESLSGAFIERALLRMGGSLEPDRRFSTQELADQLRVVPDQERLFARLLEVVSEGGILKSEHNGWIVLRPLMPRASDLLADAENLAQQYPACSAEISLTARCGYRLDEVLRGTCDPLHLLFPGGDFATADALYRHSPLSQVLNTSLRDVVVAASESAPTDRIVRVLEIGAGTGGTTSFLVPHLNSNNTQYAFTDVSPLFLARGREEFRSFPFVSFDLLDIEKPLPGSEEPSFDIVIAANALHATRDLRETLQNAVSLIAPGGLLVLFEATAKKRWVDITFGLTEGWWRFKDRTLRPDSPLLSLEKWNSLLQEVGLETAHVSPSLRTGTHAVEQAVLVGRKPLATKNLDVGEGSPGFWLVLGDTKGIAEEFASLLSDRRQGCVLVSESPDYAFDKQRGAAIDPKQREHFTRLFADALSSGKGPLRGVLSLWPINVEVTAGTIPAEWDAMQARMGGGMLYTTQTFLATQSAHDSRGARLWFATRHAQPVEPEKKSDADQYQPIQAMAWGLAREISLEHPGSFGTVIDLDSQTSSSESAASIWREIENFGSEDGVVYRNGRRFVPRIVRSQAPPSTELTLRRDGSYLITGGLGGLGLQIANWMAARGAGEILLLSRREFPARSSWRELDPQNVNFEIVKSILDTEKQGANVSVIQGDAADESAMKRLFDRFNREDCPLKGIVHAAVEPTSRSITDLDLESFQRMCHSKALGAWVLHRLSLGIELDFFVLFSSTTALFGATGLGHYAAANQALDLLTQLRRDQGGRALSVNWGTWEEMREATEQDREQFKQAGLFPMPGEMALGALERLIVANRSSAIVASIDWKALCQVYELRRPRPLFSEVRTTPRSETRNKPVAKPLVHESEFRRRLESASAGRRREILAAHLRQLAGDILGFDSAREIDPVQGLFDMGMDSLMALDFKARLERSLNAELPSTLTFNYPTLQALVDYLIDGGITLDSAPGPTDVKESAQTPISERSLNGKELSDDLSEDEMAALLLKKLEQMK